MKKLILSLALTAFAAVAAQADDAGAKATTEQHSCCAQVKAAQQTQVSCCSKAKQITVKKTAVKQALLSPKAAAAL